MRQKHLLRKIYINVFIIIVLSLFLAMVYAASYLRTYNQKQVAPELKERAQLIQVQIMDMLEKNDYQSIDRLCKRLAKTSETRVRILLSDGRVIGDTETDPESIPNQLDQPEIQAALQRNMGISTREDTSHVMMMYVAIPMRTAKGVIGIISTAAPLVSLTRVLSSAYFDLAYVSLSIVFVAAGAIVASSRRIIRPLDMLRQGAERFARGDLAMRLPVPEYVEVARLAEAMNNMASDLQYRIRRIVEQRNELEAVLSSMMEGVLAVDMDERIIQINKSATRLLGLSPSRAIGKPVHTVIANADLRRLIEQTLPSGQTLEEEIVLTESGDTYIQATGTPLRNEKGEGIGGVFVLYDITRLRHLENGRRDFVANVSHELKTPITSIKGSVETLLDGAMDDPDAKQQFLDIIQRQSNRLSVLVEDLLNLSRLEEDQYGGSIELLDTPVSEVLESAVQMLSANPAHSRIVIDPSCYCGGVGEISIRINALLLQQAIMNLLDNALKYSQSESEVRIITILHAHEITITVQDQGIGISQEHQQRIFERFYRVDKARSRKMGGTGLGLAIVKHIAQIHGGRATLFSIPGKQCSFSIHIPAGVSNAEVQKAILEHPIPAPTSDESGEPSTPITET